MSLTPSDRETLRRGREIKARVRKALKKARPRSPKADRGRVRNPAFLAYLRRQPCTVGPAGCSGPVEAAHIRMGLTGLQRKPDDSRAVPLCATHHRTGPDAQHARGERQWWEARRLDPFAIAAAHFDAFSRGFERRREIG